MGRRRSGQGVRATTHTLARTHSTIGDVTPKEFINNHQHRPHAAEQGRRAPGMIPQGRRA
jgi:hypothetical protein